GHSRQVTSVAFSADGSRVASGGSRVDGLSRVGEVRLWDAATGKLLAGLEGHNGTVTSLAFAPDGKALASASDSDNTERLWDLAAGEGARAGPRHAELPHAGQVHAVAFSPDGKTLACGGADVKLWNVATGLELLTLPAGTAKTRSLAFAPDGRTLAAGCEGGRVRLWVGARGEE